MSTPEMEALLEQAIDHVNAGELQQGRALLERVLEQDPRNDRAWVWLSGCVDDAMQRRICLQQALAANPNNQAALDGMQVLEGNLVQASESRPSLLESRLSAIGMGDQPRAERPTQTVDVSEPESAYEEYSSPVPLDLEEEEEVAPRPRRRGMLLLVVGVILLLFLIVCALVATQVVPVLLSTLG